MVRVSLREPPSEGSAYRSAMSGLLDGVRVLDLGIWRPAPYATQLLAEMGADVVKVEPPAGDPMRSLPAMFASLNAGKRALALDLRSDEGRAKALELAACADAVVEGYRPGVAARLGVDEAAVRAVNRSVVYCSISGYGQDGPLASVPGHDIDYQAWAGVLEPRDGTPVVPRPPLADLAGGAYAAMAICAALLRRAATGEGEQIDVAMADVLATWTGAVRSYPVAGTGVALTADLPGYGTFATSDGGWIALGVLSEDHFWSALCHALGLDAEAPRTLPERIADQGRLGLLVRERIAMRPRDELVADLALAGVPVAPVLSQDEVLAAEHFRRRGLVTDGPDGQAKIGHPVRYRLHPATTLAHVPELIDGLAVQPWA
jgi:crotonobetainyl-CoA:carnitine CoA-transferase CaiB-like acyl-CoA transferase